MTARGAAATPVANCLLFAVVLCWLWWYTPWIDVLATMAALVAGVWGLALLGSETTKTRISSTVDWLLNCRSLLILLPLMMLYGSISSHRLLLAGEYSGSQAIYALPLSPSGGGRWAPAPKMRLQDARALRRQPGGLSKLYIPRWSPRSRLLWLKIRGLPAALVESRPFKRELVLIPDTFYSRPVVLIRPSFGLSLKAQTGNLDLELMVDAKEVHDGRFAGKALWLGCRSDVEVSDPIIRRWQGLLFTEEELSADKYPSLVVWSQLPPESVEPDLVLSAGNIVHARVVSRATGKTFSEGSVEIPKDYSAADFPIELSLALPKDRT